MADETVTTQIIIQATLALKALADLTNATASFGKKIEYTRSAVNSAAKEWGVSFQKAKKTLQSLDAELSGTTTSSTVFGGAGQDAWNKVGNSAEEAERKVKKGTNGMVAGLNVVRLAIGIVASMLIRDLLSAITQAFTKGVEYATKFELALYNLTNAERILSKQGTEIAPQDLTEIIDNLQKLLPTLSRLDATNAVSQIAIFTKGLGLSKKQIEQLSQATAVLAVKNRAAGLSFQQVFDQLKTGLLTGTTRGITDLGININAGAVSLLAMKLAGVETNEQFKALNDTVQEQYQAQAILQVVYEQTTDELGTINEYLDTNDAKLQKNKASWAELWGTIGKGVANLIPDISGVTDKITKSLELGGIQKLFTGEVGGLKNLFSGKQELIDTSVIYKLGTGVKLTVKEYERLKEVLSSIPEDELLKIFPDPSAIKDRFTRELVESLVTIQDTATATGESLASAFQEIDTAKAQEELKDLLKDLENLKDKMDDKEQDFGIDLARFDQDALTDQNRAIQDYNLNVAQAVRAGNVAKKEANDKYHQKELEDERKFQESMRKLQEDFLYNLEDALRERDARQVLRLIDKYNMEKEAAINENSIRKEAAAENQKIEESERKAQLDEKLRVMAEEQALKMQRMNEDSALKRKRMEEDHLLEMNRMREQMDERLQEAANKMAEEYGLNAEGAQAIYDLLSKYYGTDGALAALTDQGYNAMLGKAQGFLTTLSGVIAQYSAMVASISGGFGGGYSPGMAQYGISPHGSVTPPSGGGSSNVKAYAKGGQFVATRPQQIMVGEGGQPELVQVTPMSQIANGINSTSGQNGANGLSGQNGNTQISVSVDLSPDLEARVVNKAMDGTANVISKIRRGKQ